MNASAFKKNRAARRTCWLLGLLGVGLIAYSALANYDLLWSRYCTRRLERAETLQEAAERLGALERCAARWPRVREAFVAELGGARPRLTFWFFALLDAEKASDSELLQRFGRALEEREDLARRWSHFVRWRGGEELWRRVGRVAGGRIDVQISQLALTSRRDSSIPATNPTGVLKVSMGSGPLILVWDPLTDTTVDKLENYAVLWFLGVSPLPSPMEGELKAESLSQPVTYNATKDRCEAAPVADKELEARLFLATAGKLSPGLPLPGWEGDVPELPVQARAAWSHFPLRVPSLEPSGTLYDGVWPPPGKESLHRMDTKDRFWRSRNGRSKGQ